MSTWSSPDTDRKNDRSRPPLALIAGPTASGKSDLAVELALALKAEGKEAAIVNCDSAQVYSDLQVLSARPDKQEMRGVAHHLFAAWDGATPCSTADWACAAKRTIAELHEASVVPILVGGTGLYIRTLLDGISPVPDIDPAIRSAVRAMEQNEARKALEAEDPEAASRLAPADKARTARALEVVRSSGKPISHWHSQTAGGIGEQLSLHPLVLVPEREELFARCNLRFERMLNNGAIEEVEALYARSLPAELPVMRAIGVREIGDWLKGKVSRDQMIQSGQLATRQYAKRQYTWFRNQLPEGWLRAEPKDVDIFVVFESLFLK